MLVYATYKLHWRQLVQLQHTCGSIVSAVLNGSTFTLCVRQPSYSTVSSFNALLQPQPSHAASHGLPNSLNPDLGTNSSSPSPSSSLPQPTHAAFAQRCKPSISNRCHELNIIQHSHWRWRNPEAVCSSCDLWHSNSRHQLQLHHLQQQTASKNHASILCKAVHHGYTQHPRILPSRATRTTTSSSSRSQCNTMDAAAKSFITTSSSSSVLSGDSSSSSGGGSSSPSWVDRYLPQQMRPYAHLMRLDKPIGSWLLAWPGLWTIALAADPGHLPDPWLTSLFAVGAVLMRGAGCTVNDLWDQDIDKKVQRTRSRPLAAGVISQNAALAFLVAQLLASFTILLQLNTYTQILGWCSLLLVGTYPLMKRITWWPQAFLGLCMNYGVLMGYSAAHGSCDWSVVLPMYAAGVCWTLVYDTIYAHQDTKDDAQIGVKSTALLFGDRTKTWATGFAVLQNLGLVAAGSAAGLSMPYYAAVAAGAAHQAWQVSAVDLDNGADCMAKFVSNKWYGGILYAGITADRLLAAAA